MSRLVWPPWAQCRRWWAARCRRRSQPGQRQVLWSRASSSRRSAGGTVRRLRPTLMGNPSRSISSPVRRRSRAGAQSRARSQAPAPARKGPARRLSGRRRPHARQASPAPLTPRPPARLRSASGRRDRRGPDGGRPRWRHALLCLRSRSREPCGCPARTRSLPLPDARTSDDAVLGGQPRPQQQRPVLVPVLVDVLEPVALRACSSVRGGRCAGRAPAATPSTPRPTRAAPPRCLVSPGSAAAAWSGSARPAETPPLTAAAPPVPPRHAGTRVPLAARSTTGSEPAAVVVPDGALIAIGECQLQPPGGGRVQMRRQLSQLVRLRLQLRHPRLSGRHPLLLR